MNTHRTIIILILLVAKVYSLCTYQNTNNSEMLLDLNLTEHEICIYSGYVTSNHTEMYYLLLEKEEHKNKSLTIWLNSGIGTSLLLGLFYEIGPF